MDIDINYEHTRQYNTPNMISEAEANTVADRWRLMKQTVSGAETRFI